jgi:hypothetical protein
MRRPVTSDAASSFVGERGSRNGESGKEFSRSKFFGNFVPNFRDWDSEQQKLQIKNQNQKE